MKSWRSIWSLLLLSAYVLLLLHDFIPHTHQEHQGTHQTASLAQHEHGEHGHAYNHHGHDEDGETDDENPFGYSLTHSHSHSGFSGHSHKLVYRTSSKSDLVPKLFKVQYLTADLWKIPDKPDNDHFGSFGFSQSSYDSFFSSGHGLRAPPALG